MATARGPVTPTRTCERCHCGLLPGAPGHWREVTGWTQQRNRGGANQVRHQVPTGRYLCDSCMDFLTLVGEQQALDLDPER